MNELFSVSSFPSIEECGKIFQSVATLDAIICPEWEFRYYSFNSVWAPNEMMASMRDGQGSDFFALFTDQGLIIKGFDNNIGLKSSKDIYRHVPNVFKNFLDEPAFCIDNVTFCIWNTTLWESSVHYKPEELSLLKILVTGPEGYRKWVQDYYEVDIPLIYIKSVFDFHPLTMELIKEINKDAQDGIIADIEEIGYPIHRG